MTEHGQDWHDGIVAHDEWITDVCKCCEKRMDTVQIGDVAEVASLATFSNKIMLLMTCRMLNDPKLDILNHHLESSCIIQELILHSHPWTRGPIPADIDLNQHPNSQREIELCSDKTVWVDAIKAEIDNLEAHGTYRIASLPPSRQAIVGGGTPPYSTP
jgi:hypothetical protein